MTSATNQPAQPTAEGEIVISGVDTPSVQDSSVEARRVQETPTLQHALFQGLLDTNHEPPEPEDEDG